MHLRIPRPFFVFGGAGRRDQSGIDDRALAHPHPAWVEVGFDGLKDLARPDRAFPAGDGYLAMGQRGGATRSGSWTHPGSAR